MSNFIPNRREFIQASSSLLAAGTLGILPTSAFAQEADEKDIVMRTDSPRNGEPMAHKLIKSWMTPTKLFYVRSHAPNPVIDTDSFRLKVEGLVRRPLELSLGELKKYKQHSTIATLTCAGNRRTEFNKVKKVGGVQWTNGAIGNAQWGGVSLADVLKTAEVTSGAKHVWFEGLDEIEKGGSIIPFGGSIPIEKALSDSDTVPGAMVTHTMNEKPLTPDHGAPLRMVVPGYIGARSVKWLGKIVVSDRPSPNHYLQKAYKIVTATNAIDWAEAAPIYRFVTNSVIGTPRKQATVTNGSVELAGYALPFGKPGSTITKVELSTDYRNWHAAELGSDAREYCWRLWTAKVPVNPPGKMVVVRAQDSAGGFQVARIPWNAKGYNFNAYYRMPLPKS